MFDGRIIEFENGCQWYELEPGLFWTGTSLGDATTWGRRVCPQGIPWRELTDRDERFWFMELVDETDPNT